MSREAHRRSVAPRLLFIETVFNEQPVYSAGDKDWQNRNTTIAAG